MIRTLSQIRDEMVDREAIRDGLYRYSRGIDRCDPDLLRSVYWPDAIDDHGDFHGTIEDFITWAVPQLRASGQNLHMIGNILIRIDGMIAAVESYYWFVICRPGGGPNDITGCGRYLDRFERRGDEWRIAQRAVVHDWFQHQQGTADWSKGPFGDPTIEVGKLRPDDKSYGWLGLA